MPGQRAALTALILVETAAFAYMSETVVFPTVIALAALLGWRGGWRLRLSQDRQVVVSLVAALLFVVKWRAQPHSHPDDVMFYLSPFLHSLGQFLLALQTAALYLHHDRDVLPVSLPWPGVFVMVSAGDMSVSQQERIVFQLFAAGFVVATATYFAATSAAAAGGDRRPSGFGKLGVVIALLVATSFFAWMGSLGLHTYERELDRIVSELLNPAITPSSAGFPSRSRLGSIAERKSQRSEDVALRVYSAGEPGYLRGRAYHWLRTVAGAGGVLTTQWEEAGPSASDAPATETAGDVLRPASSADGRFCFELQDRAAPPTAATMEVWLEPAHWGIYFLPLRAAEILTPEHELRRDFRQVTSGTDAGVVTYGVRSGPGRDGTPYFDLTKQTGDFSRGDLLHVPEPIGSNAGIRRTVDDLFKDCRTVEDHAQAVERYFHSNFGYAIGINPPGRSDPVEWFLRTKPNAHCEYFAQAAALLLRMRGIPTRYMTGFVAAERNEYGDFWLARNAHAHAWCEVWDDDLGWMVVEATPAAGVPSNQIAPAHRQLWETLSARVAQFRYRFAEGGWKWLLAQAVGLFRTPLGGIAILLVVGYVAIRLRMRRGGPTSPTDSPNVVEMRRLLSRIDRRLAKAGLIRKPGETLTRFATRIEAESGDTAAAGWYADYAALRYDQPDTVAIESLKERLRTLGPPPKIRERVPQGASS